jgi:hypothetical protein
MTRDFTLAFYKECLLAIISKHENILRFDEFLNLKSYPEKFCLIRHDVDRLPHRSLSMAHLEHDLGIKSTYYFRAKRGVFIPSIIKEISGMGHEIGYHYESLSDTNGNMEAAYIDFKVNLDRFREIVNINTISMHGKPLSKFDNRDLWRSEKGSEQLINLNIRGEIYLAIDYSEIAYLSDTGRNWASKNNLRDKVQSNIPVLFNSSYQLLDYLCNYSFKKMVFQVHPERWVDALFPWAWQFGLDKGTNIIKTVLRNIL